MTPAALDLLNLLSDPSKVVWKASNGRWYVTAKAGQVKASVVDELLRAGCLTPYGGKDSYRRAA